MWSMKFWKATLERVLSGAAVAVFGAFFAGDVIFDAMSVRTWEDVLSVAIGGAFGALLLSLMGNQFGPGDGPSIAGTERLKPGP